MYEAIGLAIARFRLCPEIDQQDPPSAWVEMTIDPRELTTAHKITRRQFEEWLQRRGSTPKEITTRRRVREALGVSEEKV
jgi:hypothetical protein